jgi:hypothetical protein
MTGRGCAIYISIYIADVSLKKNLEVVMTAVTQNGNALEYSGKDLKKDLEVVMTAVTQNGRAFQYADKDLKKDIEFFKAV